jgi:methionyl-tRNA synthetase
MNTAWRSHESQKRSTLRQEAIDKYDGIIRKSFSDFKFRITPELLAKIHHDTGGIFRKLKRTRGFFMKK